MRTAIVRTLEEFVTLKDDWNKLYAKSHHTHFYQSYLWNFLWFQYFGEGYKLFIIVAFDDSGIQGIAPLMKKEGNIQFIGFGLSDYGGFLGNQHASLLRAISESNEWNTITLAELDEVAHLSICSELATTNLLHVSYPTIKCMSLDLKQDLSSMLKKKSLNRHIKFLSSLGELKSHEVTQLQSVHHLGILFEQHQSIWKGRKEKSMFKDTAHQAFFLAILQQLPEVKLWSLELNGEPLALQLGFLDKGTFITYCQSHDRDYHHASPGTILYKRFIEHYLSNDVDRIDHTRGTENYKKRFSNEKHQNYTVVIHRSKAKHLVKKYWYKFRDKIPEEHRERVRELIS